MYFVYDIGGTFVKFALMENNGTVKMKDKFPDIKEKVFIIEMKY
ncbi:ROK family protein [Listeria innocua FSL S4-378]|nr:ROK family protein [Listeria innocua FSL S4-378]